MVMDILQVVIAIGVGGLGIWIFKKFFSATPGELADFGPSKAYENLFEEIHKEEMSDKERKKRAIRKREQHESDAKRVKKEIKNESKENVIRRFMDAFNNTNGPGAKRK